MEGKRNIVIVGGGIIGSTTAYYLTRHPKFNPALHTITVLEAAPAIATGASGKAGGLLALWAYPDCLVPLSYKLHAELAAEHDGVKRWGYRKLGCGSIEVTVSKKRLEQLQQANGEGKTWEKLPKQDAAAKGLLEESNFPSDFDYVDREIVETWAEMGSPGATETAQVHPHHFTTSIAELARGAGVQIKTNSKVTKLKSSPAGVEGVEYLDRKDNTTNEIQEVTDIVVAAGPWTGVVLPQAKVEGLRAHSVVYEAEVSPYAVFTDIELPSNYIPEHRAKMGQKRKHKGRVDPEIYARPFGEVYACGEPDTAIPLPETADQVECDESQCDDIISYIGTISSVLGAAPIKAKQACYLPRHMRFGQESGPLIGKTKIPGLYVASGHTCWGIQNGPATGKLMSEFIFDGDAQSTDKKKRRSKSQPIRQSNRLKKPVNPLGNNTIAANWDKKQTLAQNYKRLGLTARLKGPTGGTEKTLGVKETFGPSDPLSINGSGSTGKALDVARVERDADGKIVRVIGRAPNPLGDPLNELDSDSEMDDGEAEEHEEWGGIQENGRETEVVKSLIQEARNPAPKKKRYQSEQEREWLEKLVGKYGDDTRAMAKDRKLNPMQQTEADIRRRINKMNA
ncbi:unnamed protein product [Clonostachys rhizophaga]|uniref:FAD dependent oxidoreductase domain-containing protein n=1 Tax=Clonostachys rhizophaga TaxID=160324 RepID=A0A9N9V724_9HYPO|nr:unnamed protein product [Clonostachys rhizophaga]